MESIRKYSEDRLLTQLERASKRLQSAKKLCFEALIRLRFCHRQAEVEGWNIRYLEVDSDRLDPPRTAAIYAARDERMIYFERCLLSYEMARRERDGALSDARQLLTKVTRWTDPHTVDSPIHRLYIQALTAATQPAIDDVEPLYPDIGWALVKDVRSVVRVAFWRLQQWLPDKIDVALHLSDYLDPSLSQLYPASIVATDSCRQWRRQPHIPVPVVWHHDIPAAARLTRLLDELTVAMTHAREMARQHVRATATARERPRGERKAIRFAFRDSLMQANVLRTDLVHMLLPAVAEAQSFGSTDQMGEGIMARLMELNCLAADASLRNCTRQLQHMYSTYLLTA